MLILLNSAGGLRQRRSATDQSCALGSDSDKVTPQRWLSTGSHLWRKAQGSQPADDGLTSVYALCSHAALGF